jgi:hypothetical protein
MSGFSSGEKEVGIQGKIHRALTAAAQSNDSPFKGRAIARR